MKQETNPPTSPCPRHSHSWPSAKPDCIPVGIRIPPRVCFRRPKFQIAVICCALLELFSRKAPLVKTNLLACARECGGNSNILRTIERMVRLHRGERCCYSILLPHAIHIEPFRYLIFSRGGGGRWAKLSKISLLGGRADTQNPFFPK